MLYCDLAPFSHSLESMQLKLQIHVAGHWECNDLQWETLQRKIHLNSVYGRAQAFT